MTTPASHGTDAAWQDHTLALPIIGRRSEVELLASMRHSMMRGTGGVLLLSGDSGIGKTRLVDEAAREARTANCRVAIGRAYAVETAIPYAPFADALEPLLAEFDPNVLTRITRGDDSALIALAPSLASGQRTERRNAGMTVAEQRVRLHSIILLVLAKLAERQPLLLVLENMQWADSSSIELLHFIARQTAQHRMLVVATWNETERELPPLFTSTVRSLRSLGACRELRLEPLAERAVHELLTQTFGVSESAVASFASRLFEVTRGNPLFIEQTLRDLVQRGELRRQGGLWVGWQLEEFVLPRTVRDVLHARIDRLSPAARAVAEWIAVVGARASHELLLVVTALDDAALLGALDELRTAGMLIEHDDGTMLYHELSHPLLRQALADLHGAARERNMHAAVANALELVHGARADQHAEQIAAHWRQADPLVEPARAIRWLTMAAERSLAGFARREAALLFRAALERADATPDAVDQESRRYLVDQLSRIYRRLGEYQKAIIMATRAREDALSRGDLIGVATAERRLGLAHEGLSRRREAIAHFDAGIVLAQQTGDDVLLARLQLAKGTCLQALGQPAEAKTAAAAALEIAERLEQVGLLARAHRTLLMLHLWSGPAHRAWSHARAAVSLAERSGERNVAWSAHWAAAVLAGMTSNAPALQAHLAAATRLADELSSPLLQLRTAEIAVEYHAGLGEWERALVDGERAVHAARTFEQTTLLARLLYWVGGLYLHRGDIGTARRMFDEAWTVSGAGNIEPDQPFEVHGVLPAYVARVVYLAAVGEHARAIELGQNAVAIADRTGNMAWSVYRLLPALAESALAIGATEELQEFRRRLAHDAAWLSHPIGQAWVGIIDAEVARQGGALDNAIRLLQQAVGALEAVPYPFDAASNRVRLARALQEHGDTKEAAREATAALQIFESLGARPAAETARALLQSLGAHVPAPRHSSDAFGMLTAREFEIVKLVSQRLSNKEIGTRLGISDRTVGTHLANIYGKSGIRDRTLLGDVAREKGLHR